MGNTYQSPLDIHFLQPPEVESAETLIVFDMSKDGFHLHRTPGTQGLAQLGSEIFASLAAIFEQLETDLDVAVAFGLGALALERAVLAGIAFIMASFALMAIFSLVFSGVAIGQVLFVWADELVCDWIVLKMV